MRHIILAAIVALVLATTAVVAGSDRATVPTHSAFEQLEQRVTNLEERVTDLEPSDGDATPTPEPSELNPTAEPTPEPEPTPTTDPSPIPAPSGFPGVSNTGVPAGTKLTPQPGGTIKTAGTVIEGKEINGCIRVVAPDVVIKNSRIRCSGYPVNVEAGGELLLVDSEVDGGGSGGGNGCVGWENLTVRRVHVYGCTDGIRAADNVTVEDSLIEVSGASADSHNDGIQSTDGRNIVIRHNTILNPNGQTSAILLKADFGKIDNVLIEQNLLAGGAYVLYGGFWPDGPHGSATNVRIIDNHFSTRFFDDGGQYGPKAYADSAAEWHGNVWHESGEAIPRG